MYIYTKVNHIVFINIATKRLNYASIYVNWNVKEKTTNLLLCIIILKLYSKSLNLFQIPIYFKIVVNPKISSKNIINQFYILLLSLIKSLFVFIGKIIFISGVMIKKKQFTILRSPFIHKTSRDQLEIETYSGSFNLKIYCIRQFILLEYFNFIFFNVFKRLNDNIYKYFISYRNYIYINM